MRPQALAEVLDEAAESGLSSAGPQRRDSERAFVDLDVSLGTDHQVYAGFTENLSVSGAFVATHRLKPVGETVQICIHLPGGGEVRGIARVRWVRLHDEASATPPGMGLTFEELEPEALPRIEAFLRQQA